LFGDLSLCLSVCLSPSYLSSTACLHSLTRHESNHLLLPPSINQSSIDTILTSLITLQVQVVHSDMRSLPSPLSRSSSPIHAGSAEEEKGGHEEAASDDQNQKLRVADILVSELLGSIGDNELSPECLDGAQRLLRLGGACIPSRYTSYVAPVGTSKLWMQARDLFSGNGLHTSYVFCSMFFLSFLVCDISVSLLSIC
jgi:hypothetical protein